LGAVRRIFAMNTDLLSRSPARNLLAMAGLGVLTATFGCRLGEADVVRRTPVVVNSTGGSGGVDASPGSDSIDVDAATTDSSAGDDRSATKDAPAAGDGGMITTAVDAGSGLDRMDSKDQATTDLTHVDAPVVPGIDGGGDEGADPCVGADYEFCDGFDDGTSKWTTTGGTWEAVSENGDADTNVVFGPTTSASSIASVVSGAWQDMTAEAQVMVTSFGQNASTNRVVLYARYQDLSHFYAVALSGDGKLGLRRNAAAFGTLANVSVHEKEWHDLKIRVTGASDNVVVEGYLDGKLLTAATDTSNSLNGDVGTVAVGVYGGTLAVFDDVRVSSP
jgi:hypothetical protein